MAAAPFEDRTAAGRALAAALGAYRGRADLVVLGLPRGGLPVAREVAEALGAPLDLILVRKLGVPGHEELAMGAIASGGGRVLNEDVVGQLGLGEDTIEAVANAEWDELARRERTYRGDRAWPRIEGRCVILVDDGVATGATMRAAAQAVRAAGAAEVVVAVPVAPPDTVARLRAAADDVVCVDTPEPFMGVGRWYRDFRQTTDEEVIAILEAARSQGEA